MAEPLAKEILAAKATGEKLAKEFASEAAQVARHDKV
jgi:hypothetical protein